MTRDLSPAPVPELGFGDGLRAAVGGIGFILGTPRVWGYALVPALMALVLLGCSCPLGLWGVNWATDLILGEVTGFWVATGAWLLRVLSWLLVVMLSTLLALFLAQPLSGFALEAIAKAQRQALGGREFTPLPRASSLWLTVRVTLFSLGLGIPLLLLLTLAGLLFPPALLVTLPIKFVICGWMLAWDFLDYPWGLIGRRVRWRLSWVGRHSLAFTAFGCAWAACILVPGFVLLLLPMGVAGATRLAVAEEG